MQEHRLRSRKRLGDLPIVCLTLLATLATFGCNLDNVADPDESTSPSPANMILLSGDDQAGEPNTSLGQPLVVQVSDSMGHVVADASVRWDVINGDGHLSSTSSRTDSSGIASVGYTLGPLPGTNVVRAAVGDVTPVTFTTHGVRGHIALERDRDGSSWICVVRANGSELTELTQGSEPAWSWDGRKIAFVRDGTIYVMDADGTNETSLGPGRSPSWSPDDSKIVFGDGKAIMVMGADGSNRTSLVDFQFPGVPDGTTEIGAPAWSPDDRWIAFDSRYGSDPALFGSWQVHVMNVDGSDPHMLSPDAWSKSEPAWSPDGSRVAVETFDSAGGGGYEQVLASYEVASGERTIHLRHSYLTMVARPSWSPDGRYIAFGELGRIILLDVATGVAHSLLNDTDPALPARRAAWSSGPQPPE